MESKNFQNYLKQLKPKVWIVIRQLKCYALKCIQIVFSVKRHSNIWILYLALWSILKIFSDCCKPDCDLAMLSGIDKQTIHMHFTACPARTFTWHWANFASGKWKNYSLNHSLKRKDELATLLFIACVENRPVIVSSLDLSPYPWEFGIQYMSTGHLTLFLDWFSHHMLICFQISVIGHIWITRWNTYVSKLIKLLRPVHQNVFSLKTNIYIFLLQILF